MKNNEKLSFEDFMMSKTQENYPTVLLVGRMNVGKSALFNRLSSGSRSIVFEHRGVTRDYLTEAVTWDDRTFTLVDSGGVTFKSHAHGIEYEVQKKVEYLMNKADVLLFVCDIKSPPNNEDDYIARLVHKTKKPALLLLNKSDSSKIFEENVHEFYSLGFKEMMQISCLHAIGIGSLLDRIVELIPDKAGAVIEHPRYNIAIIGKPNVGKSSLMNLLIKHERSIVSDIPGTTREAISEKIYHCSNLIQLTDTAGIRRKARIVEDLEELMVKSSLQAIKHADVILLVIDASQGTLCDQELKLLFHVYRMKKPIVLLFNKTDLLRQDLYAQDLLKQNTEEYEFILKKVPQIFISCLSKKNIEKVLHEVDRLMKRCAQQFDQLEVNELVKNALDRRPLYHKTILLKVMHIRQRPGFIPTFHLYVNYPPWFGETQLGFIENVLRQKYDLKGCPVVFHLSKLRSR